MLDKATADADEKKKAYEQDRSAESIKKVAYDRTVEAQNRLKPAYEEAVGVETTAKESYEEAVRLLDEANKTYDDAVNDEAAKERKYNSQVDMVSISFSASKLTFIVTVESFFVLDTRRKTSCKAASGNSSSPFIRILSLVSLYVLTSHTYCSSTIAISPTTAIQRICFISISRVLT